MDIDQCFTIGLTHNLSLISSKFINKNSPLNWICNLCGNKFGILIQGPIVKNFTIDTAKYYKELYNNHEVVISTDSRLSYSEVKNLQKLKIKYVNYEPIKKNQANLSSQSHSVIQGINYLKNKFIV